MNSKKPLLTSKKPWHYAFRSESDDNPLELWQLLQSASSQGFAVLWKFPLFSGLFYKCSDCDKAFADKSAIYEHREKEKHKRKKSSLAAEFSVLYKASFLKGPSKLFSTREAFEARIAPVVQSWQKCWKFKCMACQSFFDLASDLSRHNTNWCQLQHNNSYAASKLFSLEQESCNSFAASSKAAMTASETYEKMNEHLAHLEALTSEVDNCHDCTKIGFDFRYTQYLSCWQYRILTKKNN